MILACVRLCQSILYWTCSFESHWQMQDMQAQAYRFQDVSSTTMRQDWSLREGLPMFKQFLIAIEDLEKID